jgi:hypothetical protein
MFCVRCRADRPTHLLTTPRGTSAVCGACVPLCLDLAHALNMEVAVAMVPSPSSPSSLTVAPSHRSSVGK